MNYQPTNQPPEGITPENIEGHLNAFRDGYNAAIPATVIQPIGLQDDWKEKFKDWLLNHIQFNSKGNIEIIVDHVERYIRTATPPPQPSGIDVEDMAKASLRETFNKWTGKTCTDDQWDEYLEKESIQLTLAAMIHFKAGYATSPQSSEERQRGWTIQSSTSEEEKDSDDWDRLIADIRLYENNSQEYNDFIKELKSTYKISKR